MHSKSPAPVERTGLLHTHTHSLSLDAGTELQQVLWLPMEVQHCSCFPGMYPPTTMSHMCRDTSTSVTTNANQQWTSAGRMCMCSALHTTTEGDGGMHELRRGRVKHREGGVRSGRWIRTHSPPQQPPHHAGEHQRPCPTSSLPTIGQECHQSQCRCQPLPTPSQLQLPSGGG